MSTPDMPLGDDEVEQISRIIETLDRSTFDYLQLEFGELRLTIAKGGVPLPAASAVATTPMPVAAPMSVPAPVPASAAAAVNTPVPTAPSPTAPAAAPADGTVGIASPMIGRFYSQAEPGAAPYVTVGAKVSADSTVGLVEAMKMFNAVRAGVDGTITEICVSDAALVEYGQILFRVRPA